MKRIVDVLVSFVALVPLSLLFVIISLLIVIDDPGPVFFKQKRVGRGGRLFFIIKFRSMQVRDHLFDQGFEPGNISRVTKVGKFLRGSKMDELPQLVNVLMGDMSIIGPRPEVEKWVKVYPERWEKVLVVRPGISDNASIYYRNEEEILKESKDPEVTYRDIILPKKLDYYEDYISNQSFKGDLKIFLKTFLTLLNK